MIARCRVCLCIYVYIHTWPDYTYIYLFFVSLLERNTMSLLLLLLWSLASLLVGCHGEAFWAGTDNREPLSFPLSGLIADSLDTTGAVYPAIEARGTIYLPFGNLVMPYGDIYLGGQGGSLQRQIEYLSTIAAKVCGYPEPCGGNAYIDMATCSCVCLPGFIGVGCVDRDCTDNGLWNSTTGSCDCDSPFTSRSFCTEAVCGPNSEFSLGACVCLPPFVFDGTGCIFQSNASVVPDCLDPLSGTCDEKGNLGVASCVHGHPVVCSCGPLYHGVGQGYTARQMVKKRYHVYGYTLMN